MLAINIPAEGIFLAIQSRNLEKYTPEACREITRAYISRFLSSKPEIIFLNVCYRRSLVDSQVFDTFLHTVTTDEKGNTVKRENPDTENNNKYFRAIFDCARELLREQIDVFKTAVEVIRAAGCKVYFSVRMNDGHFTDDPSINSSRSFDLGGRYTVVKDGFIFFDYSQKPIQNYVGSYIRELATNYDLDGIELDWLRHPIVLPESKYSDLEILNTYMADIRNMLREIRPNMGLAVRVLANEKAGLGLGMDGAAWIARGYADILTISNFHTPTNFEMPVNQWRTSIQSKNTDNRPYTLLCGCDWGASCVYGRTIPLTPAMVRAFCNDCYQKRTDGIYLFNFMEEDAPSSWELTEDAQGRPQLKKCFMERIMAVYHPQDLPRRYPYVGYTNRRYPIPVPKKEAYAFSMHANKPFGKCKLVIAYDTDADFTVSVNGCENIPMKRQIVHPGYEYEENFVFQGDPIVHAVSQVAPFVAAADLPPAALAAEDFQIRLNNESNRDTKLLWAELNFDA